MSSEEEEENERDWAELTQECLVNVLTRLPIEERWRGPMLVCKAWLAASKDPSLFAVFDLEPHFESAPESTHWWSPEFERKVDSMVRSVVDWGGPSVREIRVRHCSDRSLALVAERVWIDSNQALLDQILALVAKRCPNLQALSIKSCPNVTDSMIGKIALGCPMISELDISYCYEVSHASLELAGRNCPHLKILKRNLMNWLDPSQHIGIVPDEYLNRCPQDGDSDCYIIGKFMPNLEHLEVRFSKLSARGLVSISEVCIKLQYLDLFGCANLTGRDMENALANLKNLKKLVKPNFYIPRSVFHTERYGHWRLYDERFQTSVFQI
ncbi:hypothetical protein Sjap_010832 [Stephania japonica]|uniref:F-box protein n=1 Tax=Stephania japonica TaxID=461633 RepID=A0AAP0P6U7_9MAGN